MTLGERIAQLRKNKNMTQEDLAEELSVSRQTISSWEMMVLCLQQINLLNWLNVLMSVLIILF